MLVRNNSLIMAVNNPQAILSVLPQARLLNFRGKELVAVRHTLEATRILTNMGLQAPSPMLHGDYHFTGKYTPTDKQLITADFFVTNRRRAYCFNEMRTGKTSAALWAIDYLKKIGEVKRVLVICPIQVMDVWAGEQFTTLPHRSLIQIVGSADRRRRLADEPADIHVIGFDGYRSLYHEEYYPNTRKIKRRWHDLEGKFDLIVVDEASAYCNAQNWRWKALNYVVQKDKPNLWLLTGTPTPNAPTDSFGLIKLMHPNRIPASFKLYEETLMYPIGPYKKAPRDGAYDIVFQYMRPAVRFKREESHLPTTTQNIPCSMSAEQQKVFDDMKSKMMHEAEEVEITAANAAVKLIKLQQVMCGVVKDDDDNPYELNPKSRLQAVEELVREANAKTVVFVPFIHAMHQVQNYLNSKKITSEIINGTISKSERDKIIYRFKNSIEPQVLIAHPKVIAHGVDLTCADTFVWYAPTFSTEQYEQANARGEGPKKSKAVGIYHIGCHPVEWRIYDVLKGKMNMQSKLLDLYNVVLS